MRYIASYAMIKSLSTKHGIVAVDANSPAEAFGKMKRNLVKDNLVGRIHVSNVLSVEDIINDTKELEPEEFE